MVKPSGPVAVVPSADTPQPLEEIFSSMAARSSSHSASHPSIEGGASFAGSVDAVDPSAAEVVDCNALSMPDFTP